MAHSPQPYAGTYPGAAPFPTWQGNQQGGGASSVVQGHLQRPVYQGYPYVGAPFSAQPYPYPQSPYYPPAPQGTVQQSDEEPNPSIRFNAEPRKPKSKSRDWVWIGGIVTCVAGAIIVGFVVLCIMGIFPIDFLGKIGSACTLVGGCIVLVSGACILIYRWRNPRQEE